MRKTRKVIICLFCILFSLPVLSLAGPDTLQINIFQKGNESIIFNGDNKDLPPDTIVYQLEEVVVSAFNRTQRLIEVPGSLSSVGAVLIEREKPDYNIFPLLNHTPGVFAHSGATNTSRVSIRGIGARVPYATGKIRAYFNNIPLTNTSGITFIQDIDPSVVESMEIIKGPATSVYGAGLGGTITMTARRPAARQTGISNTFQAGSFGMFRNSLIADLVKDDLATSLVYTHIQSEGYRQNNEFRRDAITSVTQYELNKRTNFTGLFSFSGLKSHIPSSIDSVSFMDNPQSAAANWLRTKGYEDASRFLGGITASHKISENLSTDISLFSVWHDEKEMRPFDVFYEERFTIGSRLKTTYSSTMGDIQLDYTAGGELFYEDYLYSNHQNIGGEGVQGDMFSDNREKVNSWNVFLQADAGLNRFNLSGGMNLNYTHRDFRDLFHEGNQNQSGDYNYGFILSPRISANYVYYNRNSVYVTISHGFSPPSLAETLTPDGFINPDIRPERSWNLESGMRGLLRDGELFYDLSIYRMQVRDLLVAERVGEDAWVGKNAGESVHWGVEAEMHWVLLMNPFADSFGINELSVRSNYAFNYFLFTEFIDRENDYSGNRIPGVPDHVFYVSLYSGLGNGFYMMPSLRRVGSMAMNDPNSRFTDPYTITDLTLGYNHISSQRWNFDLFFRINNLFDIKYASMILVNAPSFGPTQPRYYYPGLPVNYTVGLRAGIQ
jgi:iron complex outermembrane recepter protein